jgi:bacillithiol biosynthesis cysteine-adding enzyme BshC
VHPNAGVAAAGSSLRIDIRRFPWINRLAADYAFDPGRLAPFFSGDVRDPQAWRQAIARAQAHPRQRDTVATLLDAQQARRGAPAEARAASARLRDAQAVAIVTGQQPGLFGGPLFTLLKALTAVQLAARVRETHGVPAVPLFWVDAEDHDWDEVNACGVLDAEAALRTIAIEGEDPPSNQPIARIEVKQSIEAALQALADALPKSEFTPGLLSDLRSHYAPGRGMADAFARWIEALLGDRGLVVFDSSDPAAKPLVADLFCRELENPGATARLAGEAGRALEALGYHAQVTPHPDSAALFWIGNGRTPIRAAEGGLQVGERVETREALATRARRHPEEFSPNVLLRPLVQDTLFPTACYVAGPSELAYLAQLRQVYQAFGIPLPLMQPRASATVVDANAARFLGRGDVALESLRPQDEAALNALLEAALPPSVEAAVDGVLRALDERMEVLAREAATVDATLENAARSALGRMQDDVRKLQAKVLQAAKRKDETLRRQFRHAQAQAFPAGIPQERTLGVVSFLNRYGPGVIDRVAEGLTLDPGIHTVLTP